MYGRGGETRLKDVLKERDAYSPNLHASAAHLPGEETKPKWSTLLIIIKEVHIKTMCNVLLA